MLMKGRTQRRLRWADLAVKKEERREQLSSRPKSGDRLLELLRMPAGDGEPMTSEVAVMNRSAVALAADSAVTIESDSTAKVYNTANKLFTLSKHCPVGVMFYGNADFVHIPWETVIKTFREKLGTDKYDDLREYAEKFIEFLKKGVPCPAEQQEIRVLEIWASYLNAMDLAIHRELLRERAKRPLTNQDANLITKKVITDELKKLKSHADASSMAGQDPTKLLSLYQNQYKYAKRECLMGRTLTPAAQKALHEYCGLVLTKNKFSSVCSGIVIAGFGEKELFPSLVAYNIDGIINGSLKLELESHQNIARDNRSSVYSFAQGEMAVQFMEGSDVRYRRYFENAVRELMDKVTETIIDKYTKETPARKKKLSEVAKRVSRKMLGQLIDTAANVRRTEYIGPIISAVAILPKEELAVLAEALVNLTSLKRRVSMDMDTVGGPIDVAVISKWDGFIWIKRKHYFDRELNPYFLPKYFGDLIGPKRQVP